MNRKFEHHPWSGKETVELDERVKKLSDKKIIKFFKELEMGYTPPISESIAKVRVRPIGHYGLLRPGAKVYV